MMENMNVNLRSSSPTSRTLLTRIIAILMVICQYYGCGHGFNMDIDSALIHRGPDGSMFGFAVSQHKDNGNSWLLVGAPFAETGQPGVVRGGAVYRCYAESLHQCQQIPFDPTGSNTIRSLDEIEQIDNKTEQWFGATVHSSGENGVIVACAPRYVYFSTNKKRREPVGTCWTSRASFTGFQEYSPCKNSLWGWHRQGFCQAGFSAAVTKDRRRLFIGAVGSYYWQGQLFSQDLLSRPSLASTKESPTTNDDSYLGYSVASGEFTGDNEPDVVVGHPKGNNLTGQVVLYTATMTNLHNITGEMIGSYFGYSVAVADVNGDGLDDIIAGAPLYTDPKLKDGSYEVGRVNVIYQNKEHDFKTRTALDGTVTKGRFGLALASLRDVNRDGFEDFAVGAPYAGENEAGVVYIYHGSKKGIRTKPSQIIPASAFDKNLRTFGFSLSGGIDADNNEYPDLLIGAYSSDRVVFLKSRPVVKMTSSLKLDPEKISLENNKGCSLKDGTLVACIVVSFCLEYSGVGVGTELDFTYQTKLDSKKDKPRLYFLTRETLSVENSTIRLRKESKHCNSVFAYLRNDFRDKLSPISVEITYDLVSRPKTRDNYNYLQPIINLDEPNSLHKQITIQKNCGQDNICIPNLVLEVTPNMDQYLIGTNQRLELNVHIKNKGEDAFEAMMYLKMPLEVSYINIDKSKLDFPISCSGADPDRTGVNELYCDIGNPLPTNKTLNFKVLLAPSKITSVSGAANFVFEFQLNSTNTENATTQEDNRAEVILPVRVEVDMVVDGVSKPKVVSYNATDIYPERKDTEADIGPEVMHTYRVDNKGLSVIREAVVYLLWPTYTLEKEHLLYLLEQPIITGNARCEEVPVNPLRVRLRSTPTRGSSAVNELSAPLDQEEAQQTLEAESLLRRRRALSNDDQDLENELSCGPTLCTRIKCTVLNLRKERPVIFKLRSRLWPQTVTKMNLGEVLISSKLVAKVTSLPYDVSPAYLGVLTLGITTTVNPEGLDTGYSSIPLWIILLAVCGGLLVLGLLALLLWRLGFFKRKRPQDEEPLTRPEKNGYKLANGDEAL